MWDRGAYLLRLRSSCDLLPLRDQQDPFRAARSEPYITPSAYTISFSFYLGFDSAIGVTALVFLYALALDYFDGVPPASSSSPKKIDNQSNKEKTSIFWVGSLFCLVMALVWILQIEDTRDILSKIRHHAQITPLEMDQFQQRNSTTFCASGMMLASMLIVMAFFSWLDQIPSTKQQLSEAESISGQGGGNGIP